MKKLIIYLFCAFFLNVFAETAILYPADSKESGKKIFGYYAVEKNGKFRMELIPGVRDIKKGMTISLTNIRNIEFFDANGKKFVPGLSADGKNIIAEIPAEMNIFAIETTEKPEKVSVSYSPAAQKIQPVRQQQSVNINPPAGKVGKLLKTKRIGKNHAVLDNGRMRMIFDWNKGFTVKEFYNYYARRNMIIDPAKFRFFILRINDRDYDISNCRFEKTQSLADGLRFIFTIPGMTLEIYADVMFAEEEFKSRLTVRNTSEKIIAVKGVFPFFGNMAISKNPAEDFYLFPFNGGLISDAPCWRRDPYGYGSCLFQMMDIYSYAQGSGFYLRADDPTGLYKHFNIRKGGKTDRRDIQIKNWPITGRIDLSMQYYTAAAANLPGTTLAIDYIERNCSKSEKIVYPDAAFAAHAGDWHKAMEIYAAWSHKTWKRHRKLSALAEIWNIDAGRGTGEPLVAFYNKKLRPTDDMLEINGYWSVTDKSPWGGPISETPRWTFKDPVTGKTVRSSNRGDYGLSGYNPQWGGLEALRKYIKFIKSSGVPLLLYTVPRIGDSETKLAREHCPDWCIVNPDWFFRKKNYSPRAPKEPKDLVFHYSGFRMCMENPDYIDWMVKNLVRLLKETGADGFRMDEFGGAGEICLSTAHKHWSGYRKGHPGHQQALALALQKLRDAVTREAGAEKILMTEFIGSDMFNAPIDGALSWQVTTNDYIANPAPVNLYRFYFPHNKVFEIDEAKRGAKKRNDWIFWLWNGVGVYNSGQYPKHIWKMLHENKDAFSYGKAHAMIPSLAEYILINRFDAANGDKVYTLLNSNCNTYSGKIMRAEKNAEYINLFNGETLKNENGTVCITIRPKSVAVIRCRQIR